MLEHELIPGVQVIALAPSERLALGAIRLIAAGRTQCPGVARAFDDLLGMQGKVALKGLTSLAQLLPQESNRKLCLGWICIRGVTCDEAAILALIEAAQRSDADAIALWLQRLGLPAASRDLRKGLAWSAAAFAMSDKVFDAAVAHLTRAGRSPRAQIRDQIETQIGPLGN